MSDSGEDDVYKEPGDAASPPRVDAQRRKRCISEKKESDSGTPERDVGGLSEEALEDAFAGAERLATARAAHRAAAERGAKEKTGREDAWQRARSAQRERERVPQTSWQHRHPASTHEHKKKMPRKATPGPPGPNRPAMGGSPRPGAASSAGPASPWAESAGYNRHVTMSDSEESSAGSNSMMSRVSVDSQGSSASTGAAELGDYRSRTQGKYVMPTYIQMQQRTNSSSTWVPLSDVDSFRPMRAWRFIVPAKLLKPDAKHFSSWARLSGPAQRRAMAYDALLSLTMAGTAKGIKVPGMDPEADEGGEGAHGDGGSSGSNGPKTVDSYTFKPERDGGGRLPQFVFGLEELFSPAGDLVAYGVWKFVQAGFHSDTHLTTTVMAESKRVSDSLRATRTPTSLRRSSDMKEAKAIASIVCDPAQSAGLGYTRITSPADLLRELRIVSRGSEGVERPFFPTEHLPYDVLTARMVGNDELGGTHPLSPEYLYNAQRPHGLSGGAIDPETGELLDIDDVFLDPTTYFDSSGTFHADSEVVTMHFQSDPFALNIYDMALPKSALDGVMPGATLLKCFREVQGLPDPATGSGENQSVRERKAAERRELVAFAEHMRDSMATEDQQPVAFDVLDPAVSAQIKAARSTDSGKGLVREEVCPTNQIKAHTNRLRTTVVLAWRDREMAKAKAEPVQEKRKAELKRVQSVYEAATKDLVHLHLDRIAHIFVGEEERSKLPAGFLAWYDGLLAAVAENDGTASMAWGKYQRQKLSADRTVWAEVWGFFGNVISDDCFIDGRDRSLNDEMWRTKFESFAPATWLTLLTGKKCNGKSIRTEREIAINPPGVYIESGSQSLRAGQNGKADAKNNGCANVYDEMPPDLVDKDAKKLEYHKTILLKRKWVHERSENVTQASGGESLKSVRNVTDHRETSTIATNYGITFIDPRHKETPCESRMGLVDRMVFRVARASPTGLARTKAEFEQHMQTTECIARVNQYRILNAASAITRLAIEGCAWLMPDLGHANALMAHWDKTILVEKLGLQGISPRKSQRREQVLVSYCVLEAVAKVFFFKQTSLDHPSGRPLIDAEGKVTAQPWHIRQLFDVIACTAPSPETILAAWSCGLSYNVSTSEAGLAALSAACGHFGLTPSGVLSAPYKGPVVEEVRFSAEEMRRIHQAAAATMSLQSDFLRMGEEVERSRVAHLEARKRKEPQRSAQARAAPKAPEPPASPQLASKRLRAVPLPASPSTTQPCASRGTPYSEAPAVQPQYAHLRNGDPMDSGFVDLYAKSGSDEERARLISAAYELPVDMARAAQVNMFQPEIPIPVEQRIARMYEHDPPFMLDTLETATTASFAAAATKLQSHREARLAYRSQCDTRAAMDEPVAFIKKAGFDAADILPSQLESLLVHSGQTLATWSMGRPAGGKGAWGARHREMRFKAMDAGSGRVSYDFTLFHDPRGTSFKEMAAIMHQASSCSAALRNSELTEVLIRDLWYMLSTEEGERLVCIEPELKSEFAPDKGFRARDGKPVNATNAYQEMYSTYSYSSKPVGVRDREADTSDVLTANGADDLTQVVHAMSSQGKLPLLNSIFSNKTSRRPPIACDANGFTLSVSAAIDHVNMMAEATLRASAIPGFTEPELTANRDSPTGYTTRAHQVDAWDDRLINTERNSLPFAYDTGPVFFTQLAHETLRDDVSVGVQRQMRDTHKVTEGAAPAAELTLAYPGTRENRLISLRVRTEKRAAADALSSDSVHEVISEAAVSLALGRPATKEDVDRYNAGRSSTRRSAAAGDIRDMSTCVSHNLRSLRERGLLQRSSRGEAAIKDPMCVRYAAITQLAQTPAAELGDTLKSLPSLGIRPLIHDAFSKISQIRSSQTRADKLADDDYLSDTDDVTSFSMA